MVEQESAGTLMLIGIAGGTGSGKTTIAHRIASALGHERACLLQHDWYYRDLRHLAPAERAAFNFDHPDALETARLCEDLARLRRGEPCDAPQYDFETHCRKDEILRIDPKPIVIVEGILLFADPGLRDLFDLRLFVDTADDIRLMRRIKRDIQERGRTIESCQEQYYKTVRPMHIAHVAPTRQHAHLILPEGGENDAAIDVVVGRLLYLHMTAERGGNLTSSQDS